MSDLEQRWPQLIEKRLIDEPPLGLEQVADIGIERPPGLVEALFEFVEKAHGVSRQFLFRKNQLPIEQEGTEITEVLF